MKFVEFFEEPDGTQYSEPWNWCRGKTGIMGVNHVIIDDNHIQSVSKKCDLCSWLTVDDLWASNWKCQETK